MWSSGELLREVDGPVHRPGVVAYSPDGTRILDAQFDLLTANIWDSQTGQLLMTLAGHTQPVVGVAYGPDGTQVATSSLDGTIRLYDATTGEPLLVFYGSPRGIVRIAFSSDGTRLASVQYDSTVRIYTLPVNDTIAMTELRLTRWWTPEECRRFLHTDICPPVPDGLTFVPPAQESASS